MLDKSSSPEEFHSGETESRPRITSGNHKLWALTRNQIARLRPGPKKRISKGTNGKNGSNEALRVRTEAHLPGTDAVRERVLERPKVKGKFLVVGDEKFWVRGVTYGTFRPDESGLPAPEIVERDFNAMSTAGLNAVRVVRSVGYSI